MSTPKQSVRIVIITMGVSRIVKPLLARDNIAVVGVVESAARNYDPNATKKTVLKKFVGVARSILINGTLKSLAEKCGIPYFFFSKYNIAELHAWLSGINPDLIVVYSMSQLLPQSIINIPTLGAINLHPSLLPAYRGPNPWFWMYYNHEKVGGVTLHYIDSGEDTGDIIAQREFRIDDGMKSPSMQDLAIGTHGVNLILEALMVITSGQTLNRFRQPQQSTTVRARNIRPEEHGDIIDWANWPIERVWHVMRGTESWLNCIAQPTGIHKGRRWVVGDFEKSEENSRITEIGLVDRDKVGYFVRCWDGKIRLSMNGSLLTVIRIIARRILD